MDLYSTSAGSISQGNVRRRGVESAHASQRARIQEIGKNWSDAQKNFDEQRDSNVEQVQQAGELREIKDQIGNAFAVSSMPAKIKSFQKWSQGGVNDIGGKITNPSSVKMGEMAKGDLKALGNSLNLTRWRRGQNNRLKCWVRMVRQGSVVGYMKGQKMLWV